VDISEQVIQRATKNADHNKLSASTQFIALDAFEYLENGVKNGQKFDVINLDPPSFAKSKKTVRKAIRGYKEIHTNACKLLNPGGFLATASCSHNVDEETFLSVINDAARMVGRSLKLLEWHGAAPDHPVLPAMPETRYLKFGIFQID
jgi:23S rRNA (cytosine1962-C5)-methyltransferase